MGALNIAPDRDPFAFFVAAVLWHLFDTAADGPDWRKASMQ
jgi:hypothetical protein